MDNKIKHPFLTLFHSCFSLSALTFGGGYVIVPLMKKKFTDTLGWLENDEMLELVALSQTSPGAMVLNCACLVGYRVAGLPGALTALAGTALPPLIIMTLLSFFYDIIRDNTFVAAALRGMQAGIAAVISDVVFNMSKVYFKKDCLPSLGIMAAAFTAAWFFRINTALIIITCASLGCAGYLVSARKSRRGGDKG